jgi:hypothetical protein
MVGDRHESVSMENCVMAIKVLYQVPNWCLHHMFPQCGILSQFEPSQTFLVLSIPQDAAVEIFSLSHFPSA